MTVQLLHKTFVTNNLTFERHIPEQEPLALLWYFNVI